MNLVEQHLMETKGQNLKLDIDLNLDKTLQLKASDVSAEYAEKNIQTIADLISFMLAIFQKRADGGRSNLKQAKRIEQMCLLHPHFSERAKQMLADPLDLSED